MFTKLVVAKLMAWESYLYHPPCTLVVSPTKLTTCKDHRHRLPCISPGELFQSHGAEPRFVMLGLTMQTLRRIVRACRRLAAGAQDGVSELL